jgi:flagellar basal-body rod protein FlgG
MLTGLFAAAAGMSAQEQQLNTVANNLANVSTDGYHAQRVAFSDLLYNNVEQAGSVSTTGAGAAARVFGDSARPGALRQTGQPLDLAIDGEGFFELKRANGQSVLTRDGAFTVDARRRLVSASGALVNPPITIPAGVSERAVTIAPDGTVRAGNERLGKIPVVNVAAPDKLLAVGEGAFAATSGSGPTQPVSGARVIQGSLEGSDVEVASEMTAMISAQRGYQMSSTAIQTEGQMLSIANQLVTQA